MTTVEIRRLEAFLFRAPVKRPMVTSFARLAERTVLLVRLEDENGAFGWGEAYCNFPPHGGEHRMALLQTLFAPLVVGRRFDSPAAAFDELTQRTAVLALQTGEPGPMAQCIAAIDIAFWDLVARRADRPLASLLCGEPAARVAAYSTGLSPEGLEATLVSELARGHQAFKLKLGFGAAVDLQTVRTARRVLGARAVAVDANQAWTLPQAIDMAQALLPHGPLWLEEPLPADSPLSDWETLRKACAIDLAAGENLYSERAFLEAIASGLFRYIQPDPIKWGGISGVARIAQAARAAGQVFCPHYIGSGLGAMACMHLVSAFGTPGSMVEVDPNENPLREPLARPSPDLHQGGYVLPAGAGLGVEPDLEAVSRFRIGEFVRSPTTSARAA